MWPSTIRKYSSCSLLIECYRPTQLYMQKRIELCHPRWLLPEIEINLPLLLQDPGPASVSSGPDHCSFNAWCLQLLLHRTVGTARRPSRFNSQTVCSSACRKGMTVIHCILTEFTWSERNLLWKRDKKQGHAAAPLLSMGVPGGGSQTTLCTQMYKRT